MEMKDVEALINDLTLQERLYAQKWMEIYTSRRGARNLKEIEMAAHDTDEYQRYQQSKLAYEYVQTQGWPSANTKKKDKGMAPETEDHQPSEQGL
jgi:hypothetical protein